MKNEILTLLILMVLQGLSMVGGISTVTGLFAPVEWSDEDEQRWRDALR